MDWQIVGKSHDKTTFPSSRIWILFKYVTCQDSADNLGYLEVIRFGLHFGMCAEPKVAGSHILLNDFDIQLRAPV